MTADLKCFQVEGEGCDATDVRLIFAKTSIEAKRRWANEHEWGDDIAGISAIRRPQWDQYAGQGVPILELIADGWWYECTGCGTMVSQDYIGTRERSHDDHEAWCLDREYGPDISRPPMEPVEPLRGLVWCHRSCYERDLARSAKLRRWEERIYAWMVRRLKRRLPDAEILPLPPTDHERYRWHAVSGGFNEASYIYVASEKWVYDRKAREARRPWSERSRIVYSPGVREAHIVFRWPGAKYGPASFRIVDERRSHGRPRKAQIYVANGDAEAFDAWDEGQKRKRELEPA